MFCNSYVVINGSRSIIAIFGYFRKKSQNLTFPLNKNIHIHEQFIVPASVSEHDQVSQ